MTGDTIPTTPAAVEWTAHHPRHPRGGLSVTHIPDPEAPHLRAIHAGTGALTFGVFFIPHDAVADPDAPTVAELDAACQPKNHIGYAAFPAQEDQP